VEDLVIDREFWRGRRVFVTGHTGFKGSWLSLWLQSLGARVYGYALAPATKPSLFQLARVEQAMESEIADVRELSVLKGAVARAAPEVVFHLAAQPLVRASYRDPVETYSTNVMGTVHLLEAVRATPGIRSVVIVTTDKCYENKEWPWGYREADRLGGHDPYSSSKAAAELVTAAYRNSYFGREEFARHGVALASARAGNVIGGGDWAEDRLIPDIVRSFAAGRSVRIRSPQAVRPWQHVLEPVGGYLLLARQLYEAGMLCAEAWNFGPEDSDAKSVEWVVERISSLYGNGASWTKDEDCHPHETSYLKLDISKARQRLRWSPRWSLERALAATVNWYRAWSAGADMHEFTLRQIDEYSSPQ